MMPATALAAAMLDSCAARPVCLCVLVSGGGGGEECQKQR